MMHKNVLRFCGIAMIALLAGCQNETVSDTENPTQAQDGNKLILNSDMNDLSARVSRKNVGLITLTNNQTASKGVYSAKTTDFSLALVA
ncbi:hypothetical protein ACG2LH_18115, partial [Zhouia sp. PK063]|uniref:hypothetical protein n=1 Tax=Zhouia sp. PK063 TaxID=3373602 RepID=UPI0037B7AAB4